MHYLHVKSIVSACLVRADISSFKRSKSGIYNDVLFIEKTSRTVKIGYNGFCRNKFEIFIRHLTDELDDRGVDVQNINDNIFVIPFSNKRK